MNTIHLYVFLAAFIALVILEACFGFNIGSENSQKIDAYECGFSPYDDTRNVFDIKFYIVAILYLIFDLEALFFYPFAAFLSFISTDGIFVMFDFIVELLIGYFYAWFIGALSWN